MWAPRHCHSPSLGRGDHPAGSHQPARPAAPIPPKHPPSCIIKASSKQMHPMYPRSHIYEVETHETEPTKKKLNDKYLHSNHLRGPIRSIFCPHFSLSRGHGGFLLLLQLHAGRFHMKRCSYRLEALFPPHPRRLYRNNRLSTVTLHP